jgi:co-chaperonin GroES (HSP10)
MPAMVMSHDVDPREALVKALGDLSDVDIFHNQVLVAVYQRPEKTKTGLFLPDQHRDEDRFQSKVGVIVKMGGRAFKDKTGEYEWPADMGVGDLVIFRVSDGWPVTVNKTLCRLIDDTSIRARIQHPDTVW